MLKIESIKLSPGQGMAALTAEAARLLRVREKDLLSLKVLRRSIDARKGEVSVVYTVEAAVKDETAVLKRCRDKKVTRLERKPGYLLPASLPAPEVPPVVVGAGPAGLFAALVLARAGLRPILLERGRPVERRKADVDRFWSTGELDLTSNVQFGEGGAGAFSDGKLNTGTKDIRHRFILETLVSHGAPEDILIDAKPHVGTDYLHITLQNLRRDLLSLGADIRFESQLTDLTIENGALTSITVTGPGGPYSLPCRHLVLCPGHSARDTFEMLHARGVPMEAKPFAVGVRIEQRQADCDAAQYKQYAGHPGLPASTYKLSCHLPNGRSAFSFCVCPGGEVVAALLCGGLEELVVELGAAFEQLLVLGVGGEEHVGEGESLASPVGDEALLEVLDGVDVVVGEHDAGGGGCAGGDGEGLGDGDGVAAAAGGGEDSGVGEFVAAGERAVAEEGVAAVVLLGDGGVEAVVGAEGEVEVSPFDAVVVPGAREHLGMGGGLGEELEASAAVSSGDGLVSGAVDAEVTGEVEFDGDVVGLAVVGGGGPVEVGDGA